MLTQQEIATRLKELFPGLSVLLWDFTTCPYGTSYRVGYFHPLCGTPIVCGTGPTWEDALNEAQTAVRLQLSA